MDAYGDPDKALQIKLLFDFILGRCRLVTIVDAAALTPIWWKPLAISAIPRFADSTRTSPEVREGPILLAKGCFASFCARPIALAFLPVDHPLLGCWNSKLSKASPTSDYEHSMLAVRCRGERSTYHYRSRRPLLQ